MESFLQHVILCILPLCAMIGALTGDAISVPDSSKKSRHMSPVTKDDRTQEWQCDAGYFLHQRNRHDPGTGRCTRCTNCSTTDKPYEAMHCNESIDALCCSSPDMLAQEVSQGFYDCVSSDCSNISQHMNLVTKYDGTQECRCEDGYYMHQRNVHDPDTRRCTRCTNCSTTDKPYEAMHCNESIDALCCSSPDMLAQEVSQGFYDCVSSDCSNISQHMNLVTKDDGTQECRCEDGYYMHQRNVHDPDTRRCTRCTNCSTTDKPYEAMHCNESIDALCCSSPDMLAQEVSQGFYDCVSSDCSNISQHMNLVTKYDGTQECRCEDGYYMHQRNVHDPDTRRCTRCTNCSTTDKPYEAMHCNESIDALCCSSPDMLAQEVSQGLYDCVSSDCSNISQHMNLVTKDDGTQECRCEDGYYMHQRNVHDPDTRRCTRCTNCSTTDKPYEAMHCNESIDALCCSSPDMLAQEVSQGLYDCVSSDCSNISQHMNLVTKYDGTQECRCEDGYYMHQRNVHDPDTRRCTRCTNCSTTDKPYEAMHCNESIDALCCSSPDMLAQEVSQGFYDCVSSDCSNISQHMNLVTKYDGTQECRCEDGYYMHQRNVHDPDTRRCTRCTNCSTTDKHYEAMPCNESIDALCCSSPDMKAQKVSQGSYKCVQPITQPTTTTLSTTTSTTSAPSTTQQSLNITSTKGQQSLNITSTKGQQSLDNTSTKGQQSLNITSTKGQQSLNNTSTKGHQSLNNTSTKEKYDITIRGCNGPRMNIRVDKDGLPFCECEGKFPSKKEGKEFVCDGQEESKNYIFVNLKLLFVCIIVFIGAWLYRGRIRARLCEGKDNPNPRRPNPETGDAAACETMPMVDMEEGRPESSQIHIS